MGATVGKATVAPIVGLAEGETLGLGVDSLLVQLQFT